MGNELTRRQMMTRSGFALGGVLGLGLLGCSGAETASPDGTNTGTNDSANLGGTPQVANYPYEQFLPAGYRLDVAAVKEVAYHGYYAGGCCHGSFSALIGHLASTVGAPFTLLPIDFGKFGAGGIASYGSICGSVLGGVLVMNFVVADATARSAMMTDLMRWYEREAFPKYVPTAIDTGEKGLTLDFSAGNIVRLETTPRSHLCHASVSGWCAANQVSATGADKKARCARLTADVAGKSAEMMNSYLSSRAYMAGFIDPTTAACVACHTPATKTAAVASGMECAPCHTDKVTGHPWSR